MPAACRSWPRPPGVARSRRFRALVRRSRRPAADAAVPLHRHPARMARMRPPHDYGVVIILLGVADRVVPAEQVAAAARRDPRIPARLAPRHGGQSRGPRSNSRARGTLAHELPEPARTLMSYVNNRDVAHLGPILLPHVAALGDDPALSPARSASPACPSICCTAPTTTSSRRWNRCCWRETLRARGVTVQLARDAADHPRRGRPLRRGVGDLGRSFASGAELLGRGRRHGRAPCDGTTFDVLACSGLRDTGDLRGPRAVARPHA